MTRVLCAEQITEPNTTSPDTLFIVKIVVGEQPEIIFEQGSPNNVPITMTTDAKYYKITAAGQSSESQAVFANKAQATTPAAPPAPVQAPAQAPALEPVTDEACGLTNPSSLCYANSAIQLLLDIPEIPEYFNKITDKDIDKLDTKYEDEKNNIKLLRTIFNKIKTDSAKKTPTNIINILKESTQSGAEPSTANAAYHQLVEKRGDDFLKNENDITTEAAELLKATNLTDDEKKAIIKHEKEQMSLLQNKYRQADAHEFLSALFFNNFHANTGLIRLDTPNNFTKKIGVNETTETICKNKTKYDTASVYSPMITLLTDNTNRSIKALLEKRREIEIKNDETEGCKTGEAEKGTRISVQTKDTLQTDTKYIILYLNRNMYDNSTGQQVKNNTKIDIDKEITINDVKFRRKGCIFHKGTVEGGHYVYGSYDKAGNPKHVRDDAKIIEHPTDIAPKVFEQDGYLSTVCLYERIEPQPPTIGGSAKTKKRKHKNKKRKTQHKK